MSDESTDVLDAERPAYMNLPKESQASYILNGVSNGIMLLGLPAMALEHFTKATAKEGALMSAFRKHGTVFGVVSGTVLGGLYGLHEASRIHEYRVAVSNELGKLRNEVNALKTFQDKVRASKADGDKKETVVAR